MSHHSRHTPSALHEIESLALIAALLWLALAVIRWLVQHPRMIPLVALALYLVSRSSPR